MDINYFAERVKWWCLSGNLGYDQHQRNNFYVGGEVDCSSLVILTLQECGFNTGNATYTGNMRKELVENGFNAIPIKLAENSLVKGDILLTEEFGHTAVYIGDGMIAHARIDERGRIFGGQTGDQTGTETMVQAYYNHPWQFVLRFNGELSEQEKAEKIKQNYSGEEIMFIITRIGDDAHYLVNGLSMIEITPKQLDSLLTAGVRHVHLYPADVYNIMDIAHESVVDVHKTTDAYQTALNLKG